MQQRLQLAFTTKQKSSDFIRCCFPVSGVSEVAMAIRLERVEERGVLEHRAGKLLEQPIGEVISGGEEALHESDVAAVRRRHDCHVFRLARLDDGNAVAGLK